MDYDYNGSIETLFHSYIRSEPRTESDYVTEVNDGIRMKAAKAVEGGPYYDGVQGTDWFPVEYDLSGVPIHGFIAAGICSVKAEPI